MELARWHGVHQGLVPDKNGPLLKVDDLQEFITKVQGEIERHEREDGDLMCAELEDLLAGREV